MYGHLRIGKHFCYFFLVFVAIFYTARFHLSVYTVHSSSYDFPVFFINKTDFTERLAGGEY